LFSDIERATAGLKMSLTAVPGNIEAMFELQLVRQDVLAISKIFPQPMKVGTLLLLAVVSMIHAAPARQEEMGEPPQTHRRQTDFSDGWRFHQGVVHEGQPESVTFNDAEWERLRLPHSPRLAPPHPDPMRPSYPNLQWEGVSWYRKTFKADQNLARRKVFIEFEAANKVADVWFNEVHLKTHEGGYLPFWVDLTKNLRFGESNNVVAVRVDNTQTPTVPIALKDWFNYGGLYRGVWFHVMDRLHVTDSIDANKVAGGGIFVTFPRVDSDRAELQIQTDVENEYDTDVECTLRSTLRDQEGQVVGSTSNCTRIEPGRGHQFMQQMTVTKPCLWHPEHPHLYTLESSVYDGITPSDVVQTRIGIRHFRFTQESGFEINGQRLIFRGVNRLQNYPYLGYAAPDSAQRRDAILLRDAGFDFVRTAQYPHSTAFMDACDELGLMVMDEIPGVHEHETFQDPEFQRISFQNMRDLIRRDRNHASVILWELSLAETQFDMTYAEKAVALGHAEYPGDQCYVAGWLSSFGWSKYTWTRDVYDVYFRNPDHWPSAWEYDGDSPFLISAYGHWRYGGLNSSSDVRRQDGERAMLQQVRNHQESHNRNRSLPFVAGDALFCASDYAEWPSGILDDFRIPKYSYYFHQSQRDPDVVLSGIDSGPMVFIANEWTESSPRIVTVFSNCEKVRLYVNGQLKATGTPDSGKDTEYLAHPPYTFTNMAWEAGELKAVGLIDGAVAATHLRRTPQAPAGLRIRLDTRGCDWSRGAGRNLVFAFAEIIDANDTVVPDAGGEAEFDVSPPAWLVSPPRVPVEAGIASALIRVSADGDRIIVRASSGEFEAQTSLRIP